MIEARDGGPSAADVRRGELLDFVQQKIRSELPKLSNIVIDFNPPVDEVPMARFVFQNGTAVVEFPYNNFAEMDRLIADRALANGIIGELLGVEDIEKRKDLIAIFIFLHEFGHALDYVENYLNNPQLDGADAFETWQMAYDAEKAGLPVPDVHPSDLKFTLAQFENLEQLFASRPEFRDLCQKINVQSIEELIWRQEKSYRALPAESYADNFAVNFIKKHLSDLLT